MASTTPSDYGTVAETPNPDTQTAVVETVSNPAAEAAVGSETESATADGTTPPEKKWPGWPGDCVFRLIVPVLKVGSIIGRKGDIIRKMCEDTKARIRVLDAPVGTPDRIVLISGKEETELPLSPAMDAVMRIFKRINGFSENEGESLASVPFCSIRLLVPSMQGMSLIGKQGSSIKSIQESTGCSVRVLSGDEVAAVSANSEDRIVDMQGEAIKVEKALEAVMGHLRKFLVDRSVLPLFEKNNAPATGLPITGSQLGLGGALFLDREPPHGLSLYGRDPGLPATRSPAIARTGGPIVTQVVQTMQIPLVYAEDIIGIGGTNIAYIRRTSGAILTVQESRGLPDEITVEIKGTASQVQTAQQLIEECVNGQKESSVPRSSYGNGMLDSGLMSSYSQSQSYSVYGLGGYRM